MRDSGKHLLLPPGPNMAGKRWLLSYTKFFLASGMLPNNPKENSINIILFSLPSGISLVRVLFELGPEITNDPAAIRALLVRFNVNYPPKSLITHIMSTLHRQAEERTTMCDVDADLHQWLMDNMIEEPPVWPVILWVTFRLQYQVSPKSTEVDILLSIIESDAEENTAFWAWDDIDNNQLLSRDDANYSLWVDRYAPAWREYILELGSNDWARLESLTRKSTRTRLYPPEYDAAIRIGAILFQTSTSKVFSAGLDTIAALNRFVPGHLATSIRYRDFLVCLLEGGSSAYKPDSGMEAVDWEHPGEWLVRNRKILRSNVLHDPHTGPLVHKVENIYMICNLPHALPQVGLPSTFVNGQ
jgi:hypothetical protein